MKYNIEGGFVLCALGLLVCCAAPSVYGHPTVGAEKSDDAGKAVSADGRTLDTPIAEITNELEKLLASMKQKEKLRLAREAGPPPPGPKNIVLIMSHAAFLTSGQNSTEEKRSLLAAFPVSHYVKHKKKRSPEEPLLVITPKLLPLQGSYDSTRSCQAALDHAVSALLEGARSKRQMVTAMLATENVALDPLTNFLQTRAAIPIEQHEHSIAKRSTDEVEKKQEEDTAAIEPINDKFQKIGIEDKGTGILYKKVEIVGGAKKNEVTPPAKEPKEKVVKRETEKTDADTGRATEAESFDFFQAIDRMRRNFLDHFFRGMGFGFPDVDAAGQNAFGFESPMVGMVDSTLTDLKRDAKDTGFLLVVSGGDANETNQVVKLVQKKSSPSDTLVIVTGMCPEPEGREMNGNFWQFDPSNQMKFSSHEQRLLPKKNREVTMIPLYASGPKSERLMEVDVLWSVPEVILNITMENLVPKTSAREKEFYLYKNDDDDKSAAANPIEIDLMKNAVEEDNGDSKAKSEDKSSEDKNAVFPTKHRVGREVSSAEWSQVQPQHVREKMTAPASAEENVEPEPEGDEAAPIPASWFADEEYSGNEVPREQGGENILPVEAREHEEEQQHVVKRLDAAAVAGTGPVSACAVTYAVLAVARLF